MVAFVRAAVRGLELGGHEPEILLGGGLMQAGDGRLVEATRSALTDTGLAFPVRAVTAPPILGAALLGLDDIGAGHEAQARIGDELRSTVPASIALAAVPGADQGPVDRPGVIAPGLARG